MPPKDDPETAALKKELTDLIAKFQVGILNFFFFFILKIKNKNLETKR